MVRVPRLRRRSDRFRSTPLRHWATGVVLAAAGPAIAAPSAVETLDRAVNHASDDAESLPVIAPASGGGSSASGDREWRSPQDRPVIRPVSDQQTAPSPTTSPRPQPSPSQLEVMKELEELYRKDGRAMPSLRMKDAPNTRLPNGQRPAPSSRPRGTSGPASPSMIQPVSGPPMTGVPPAPSGMETSEKESKNLFTSLFSRDDSREKPNKPSIWDRLRGRSRQKSSSTTTSSGGLFGKMFGRFRKDEPSEPAMLSTQPPVPPSFEPARFATKPPTAPMPFETPSARPLPPVAFPAESPHVAGPAAVPERPASREPNPFAEVEDSVSTAVVSPATRHPSEDAFAEVRGTPLPNEATIADLDPEFATPAAADVSEAPRTLDPEAVSSANDVPGIESDDATPPKSSAARYAELQRKLAERAGLGGFQGFCPVCLRDKRELVDSRPEFLSVYRGRTYELSSAEAKARFEADPARYAPVNDGNDVILTSRGEAEAEGNLNQAVWFKDRLYLFRTAESLAAFNADPTGHAVIE